MLRHFDTITYGKCQTGKEMCFGDIFYNIIIGLSLRYAQSPVSPLSRMVSGEGSGIRLYRFLIIAFSSTFRYLGRNFFIN